MIIRLVWRAVLKAWGLSNVNCKCIRRLFTGFGHKIAVVNSQNWGKNLLTAKILEPRIWKGFLAACSNFGNSATISADANGLQVKSVDEVKSIIIHAFLTKEMFSEYELDAPFTVVFNLDELIKVTNRAGSSDDITLIIKPDQKAISIVMSREKTKGTRKFELRAIEPGDDDLMEFDIVNIENFDFTGTVELDPAMLAEVVKDAEIYSEDLTLEVTTSGELLVKTNSSIGELEAKFSRESLDSCEIQENAAISLLVEHLKKAFKFVNISDHVVLEVAGAGMPIRLTFDVEGTVDEKGVRFAKIYLMIAPVQTTEYEEESWEDQFEEDVDFDEEGLFDEEDEAILDEDFDL
ncbi:MAG: hypothetical protein Kow0069_08220 [Promethearchaeota archaeon]